MKIHIVAEINNAEIAKPTSEKEAERPNLPEMYPFKVDILPHGNVCSKSRIRKATDNEPTIDEVIVIVNIFEVFGDIS